ncbi:hypothetical protein IKG02_01730 [Candidatus Saccharibacteria bacterium]|nr:hypothetical protein [Candidatus Saccharibacteria bacterium]
MCKKYKFLCFLVVIFSVFCALGGERAFAAGDIYAGGGNYPGPGGSGQFYNHGYWAFYKISGNPGVVSFPDLSGSGGFYGGIKGINTSKCLDMGGIYILHFAGSTDPGYNTFFGVRDTISNYFANRNESRFETNERTQYISGSFPGPTVNAIPSGLTYVKLKSGLSESEAYDEYKTFYLAAGSPAKLLTPDQAFYPSSSLEGTPGLSYFCGYNVEPEPDPDPPEPTIEYAKTTHKTVLETLGVTDSTGKDCVLSDGVYLCDNTGIFKANFRFVTTRTDSNNPPKNAYLYHRVVLSLEDADGATIKTESTNHAKFSSAQQKGNDYSKSMDLTYYDSAGDVIVNPDGTETVVCAKVITSNSRYEINDGHATLVGRINTGQNIKENCLTVKYSHDIASTTFVGTMNFRTSNSEDVNNLPTLTKKSASNFEGDGIHTRFYLSSYLQVTRKNNGLSIASAPFKYKLLTGKHTDKNDFTGLALGSGTSTFVAPTKYKNRYLFTGGDVAAGSCSYNMNGAKEGYIDIPFGSSCTVCTSGAFTGKVTVDVSPSGTSYNYANKTVAWTCAKFTNPRKSIVTTYDRNSHSITPDDLLTSSGGGVYSGLGFPTTYKIQYRFRNKRTDTESNVSSGKMNYTVQYRLKDENGTVTKAWTTLNTGSESLGNNSLAPWRNSSVLDVPMDRNEVVQVCFREKMTSSVEYGPDASGAFTQRLDDTEVISNKSELCITINNAERFFYADFTGDIGFNWDPLIRSIGGVYSGDGIHVKYDIGGVFSIRRKSVPSSLADFELPIGAKGGLTPCLTTSSDYSCDSRKNTTSALNVGDSQNWNYGNTITIPYNQVTPICFYTDDRTSRREYLQTGENTYTLKATSVTNQMKCVDVKNPQKKYVAEYSANSSGKINQYTEGGKNWISLSDGDTVGTINNAERNDDESWRYVYPNNNTYQATFTHVIKRDSSRLVTGEGTSDETSQNTNIVPSSLRVDGEQGSRARWKIQHSIDGGTNWEDLTDYSIANFTSNNSQTVSSGAVDIPQTFDLSNKGRFINYCQRLYYSIKTQHYFEADDSAADGRKLVAPKYNYIEGPMACVLLKNPEYQEKITPDWTDEDDEGDWEAQTLKENRTSTVSLNLTPKFSGEFAGGLNDLKSSNNIGESAAKYVDGVYKMKLLEATPVFDHSLAFGQSGFDEAVGFDVVSGVNIRFSKVNGSMYKNENFNLNTDFSANETIRGTTATLYPFPNTNSPYGINGVRINSFNSFDPAVWNSNSGNNGYGRTASTFDGNAGDDNIHRVMAGETVQVCEKTVAEPGKWVVKYVDIMRREYYRNADGTKSEFTTPYNYDRTQLYSTESEAVDGAIETPEAKRACISLKRERNYKVDSAEPKNPDGDPVKPGGQLVDPTFEVTITDDNDGWKEVDGIDDRQYVTDPDSEYHLVWYVLSPEVDKDRGVEATRSRVEESDNLQVILNNDLYNGKYGTIEAEAYERNGDGVYEKKDYTFDVKAKDAVLIPTDIPVGAKFCYRLQISRYSSTSSSYYYGQAICTNVSKNPTMHVLGAGVGTNGGVVTSSTESLIGDVTNYIGSWTDLETIANTGTIRKFSSGKSLLAKRTETSPISECKVFPLTIANDKCNTEHKLGESGISLSGEMISKLLARYRGVSGTVNLGDKSVVEAADVAGAEVEQGDETPTVHKLQGTTFIYSETGRDITINTNIYVGNSGVQFSNGVLPQVIIVNSGGNINIAEGVTHLDAWIIASGTVNTCTTSTGGSIDLSADTCANQLTITGPVVGANIRPRRTYGADTEDFSKFIDGAEIFDLNPGAYIFGANEGAGTIQPRITYLKSMPARF